MSAKESTANQCLITRSLQEWKAGDKEALARLTDAVYAELRRMAGAILSGHARSPTIEPTLLVHELYFQLPNVQDVDWQSRAHFLHVAAKMMRNILVDHARKRNSAKRGGGVCLIVSDVMVSDRADDPSMLVDVLAVNTALDRFAERYPRQARVVELRFFGGLTTAEIVEVLSTTEGETSTRTVERDWTFARAWLERAMGKQS